MLHTPSTCNAQSPVEAGRLAGLTADGVNESLAHMLLAYEIPVFHKEGTLESAEDAVARYSLAAAGYTYNGIPAVLIEHPVLGRVASADARVVRAARMQQHPVHEGF